MSVCFYLLPGARLAPEAAARLDADTLNALSAFGRQAGEVKFQTLCGPAFEGAPHYAWLWRVLSGTSQTAPIAAAHWRAAAAPGCPEGLVEFTVSPEPAPETIDRLIAVAQAHGWRLQRPGRRFYLTGPVALDATARPESLPRNATAFEGPDARAAEALERALGAALPEGACARITAVGGGRFRPKGLALHALQTNDETVVALAALAGLRANVTAGCDAPMPPAPEGDAVFVDDALYAAYLAQDWTLWRAALPKALARLDILRRSKARFPDVIPVLFGRREAATLMPFSRGISNLFARPGVSPEAWLAEHDA